MKLFKLIFNIVAEVLILGISVWLLSIHLQTTTTAVGTLVSSIVILPLLLTCLGTGLVFAICFVISGILKKNIGLVFIHLILIAGYACGLITTFAVM